ncbi:MAG: hypothetical protein M4579_006093 [Chaenotheca gracillima]|nr:MAG: hypothetical protein M4579_006093 [Chaenotheca gracillima]
MDAPYPGDDPPGSPQPPDLLWTPEIEHAVDHWARTGTFPFPELQISAQIPIHNLSRVDLRLIHHVASISVEMQFLDAGKFTVWTQKIPTFLSIASVYPFVMHSLLAFSATHLTWITESQPTENMAYYHRGVALNGLQEAIGTFSRENSDAVLAASMLLKWQFPDWHGWAHLMQGTATVVDAMQAWKQDSLFADVIAEQAIFPRAPPSPVPLDPHRVTEPRQEDLAILQQVYQALRKVESYVSNNAEEAKGIDELMSLIRNLRLHLPVHSAAEQFKLLQPLRGWLFWLPISFLQRMDGDPSVLVVIAHFYAVALAMEPLFPEVGSAYFGSMSITPIEEIMQSLTAMQASGQLHEDLRTPLSLMEFPLEMIADFRSRIGWIQGEQVPAFDPLHHDLSHYGLENFDFGSGTSGNISYTPSIQFGYAGEETHTGGASPASNMVSPSPTGLASGSTPYGVGLPQSLGAGLGAYSPSAYSSVSSMSNSNNPLAFIEEEGEEYSAYGTGPPSAHFSGGNNSGVEESSAASSSKGKERAE